jgi:hypothetical protein
MSVYGVTSATINAKPVVRKLQLAAPRGRVDAAEDAEREARRLATGDGERRSNCEVCLFRPHAPRVQLKCDECYRFSCPGHRTLLCSLCYEKPNASDKSVENREKSLAKTPKKVNSGGHKQQQQQQDDESSDDDVDLEVIQESQIVTRGKRLAQQEHSEVSQEMCFFCPICQRFLCFSKILCNLVELSSVIILTSLFKLVGTDHNTNNCLSVMRLLLVLQSNDLIN